MYKQQTRERINQSKRDTQSKKCICIWDELKAREKKESLNGERIMLLNSLRAGKKSFVPVY